MRLASAARRRSGFTLVEVMIVVLIIGIILMIAIPTFLGAREKSQSKTCQQQLRQIKYAKECWAMDNRKDQDDVPQWADVYPTYLKKMPACPAGGTYTIGAVGEDPTCSLGGNHSLDGD